jgi:hypothetical protein
VEEEGIKSALELAMERISGMPDLTPEEKAEQKEREHAPIGAAIAVRYMGGALTDTELPIELKRYRGSRQQIVRRALISSLCREMRPEKGRETALKALRGIVQIAPEKKEFLEKAEKSFSQILSDFEKDKKASYGRFEASSAEKIRAFGISGSAVRLNLNENEAWSHELIRLAQACEPRLEKLRDALIEELNSMPQGPEDSE